MRLGFFSIIFAFGWFSLSAHADGSRIEEKIRTLEKIIRENPAQIMGCTTKAILKIKPNGDASYDFTRSCIGGSGTAGKRYVNLKDLIPKTNDITDERLQAIASDRSTGTDLVWVCKISHSDALDLCVDVQSGDDWSKKSSIIMAITAKPKALHTFNKLFTDLIADFDREATRRQ